MNAITTLTPQQLRNAADIQERIQSLQHELNELLGSDSEPTLVVPIERRKLSARGLANIRAGARKRWAATRKGAGSAPIAHRRKGKMSAAGRARIAAALKARWAAAKRAGRTAL
jgi:hypothetical protein